MAERDEVDARLEVIRAVTEALAPRRGFAGRLERRIEAARRAAASPWAVLAGDARRVALACGALVAVAALVGWEAERRFRAELAGIAAVAELSP